MGVELVSKDGGHVGDMGVMRVGGEVLYIGAARVPRSITCNTLRSFKYFKLEGSHSFCFLRLIHWLPPPSPRV